MTKEERQKLIDNFMHKEVDVTIDRPIGYMHHKNAETIVYPVNYGFISGVFGGDGEELDVYIIGINEPLQTFHGKIIAAIHRENDVEDKLVACPVGMTFSEEEIFNAVSFRESHYRTHIEI